MTDPIADMLTRIKNAILARHNELEVPHSKVKEAIVKILAANGYLESYEVVAKSPQSVIVMKPKYFGKTPAITDLKRISKPGQRRYFSVKYIPRALGGYGLTIVSTSKGLLTDKEAKKQNLGGEVMCQVW